MSSKCAKEGVIRYARQLRHVRSQGNMPRCIRWQGVPMHVRECYGVPEKCKGAPVSNAWK